jgi:hypothetical protein
MSVATAGLLVAASVGQPARADSARQASVQTPRPADIPVPAGARYDPDLTRLFTPAHVPPGTYGVYVTTEPIENAAAFYRESPGAASSANAWRIQPSDPMQALGTGALFDRALVARLYSGKPLSLARGSIRRGDRVVASVTLLTPHPDAALAALQTSTMVIVFRIPER